MHLVVVGLRTIDGEKERTFAEVTAGRPPARVVTFPYHVPVDADEEKESSLSFFFFFSCSLSPALASFCYSLSLLSLCGTH